MHPVSSTTLSTPSESLAESAILMAHASALPARRTAKPLMFDRVTQFLRLATEAKYVPGGRWEESNQNSRQFPTASAYAFISRPELWQ